MFRRLKCLVDGSARLPAASHVVFSLCVGAIVASHWLPLSLMTQFVVPKRVDAFGVPKRVDAFHMHIAVASSNAVARRVL